jgi:hypothetical protein
MIKLWDEYSGLPGLLEATPEPTRKRTGYSYANGKYKDLRTGATISDRRLNAAVAKISDAVRMEMRKKTQQLVVGAIALLTWYHDSRELLRAFYRAIWVVGLGGIIFEDDQTMNLFFLFILNQFSFFDGLASRIQSGEQKLNGAAMEYAGMYGEHGNIMHQNLILKNAISTGKYTEARRVLGNNELHCDGTEKSHNPSLNGCVELSRLGWVPIDKLVPLGSTICLDKCHCRVEFR